MRRIIATGTDVAMVCFFDPTALHESFESPASLYTFSQLQKEGRIWYQETGADGAYLFHFYVEEEIPERILKFACDPKELAVFHIPGGRIVASGAEYADRDPGKAGLNKFQHMGGAFDLPKGEYAVKAWRTEWPEDLIENEMEKNLGKGPMKAVNRLGVATGILFLTTLIVSLVAIFKTLTALGKISPQLKLAWALAVLGWAICIPPHAKIVSRRKKSSPTRGGTRVPEYCGFVTETRPMMFSQNRY